MNSSIIYRFKLPIFRYNHYCILDTYNSGSLIAHGKTSCSLMKCGSKCLMHTLDIFVI